MLLLRYTYSRYSIDYLKTINKYDIILTDREMGAFNGPEVLKKIKSLDSDKKVVLMTARSEYNQETAIAKGFDDYLRKPFSIKDLSRIINTDIPADNETEFSKFQNDFPELCSMFNNDDSTIETILRVFADTTSDNLLEFNEIICNDEFKEAVRLCHKMCPMFVQLNQKECYEFLYKMDRLRDNDENSFPEWKEESIMFMNKADDLLAFLSEKYNI